MSRVFVYDEKMADNELRKLDPQPALLSGFHRAFAHSSKLLWGTESEPCPIIGLLPGGECWGLVCRTGWTRRRRLLRRVEPEESPEQFRRSRAKVQLRDGSATKVTVWVSDPDRTPDPRWTDPDELDSALRAAHGTAGRGIEYVRDIVHAMQVWGISDPLLESTWERLKSWRPT